MNNNPHIYGKNLVTGCNSKIILLCRLPHPEKLYDTLIHFFKWLICRQSHLQVTTNTNMNYVVYEHFGKEIRVQGYWYIL